MKKMLLLLSLALHLTWSQAQIKELSGDYKIIHIGGNGHGDYTRSLILLHQIYNGTPISHNYAIGTITAMRGSSSSFDRLNVAHVNTSSALTTTNGSLTSHDESQNVGTIWKLKTCIYSGMKYIAVEVPYGAAYHDLGYTFNGATLSTGSNMICISYEVNGQPINQSLISNIQDYNAGMIETHEVGNLNITGKVGIGIQNTFPEMLAVNGKVRAHEIKVETSNWPDYVFESNYKLPTLDQIKSFINLNHHLPEIPSEREISEKGLNLGEMNKLLLKKVEELTLYLIEKDRIEKDQNKIISEQQQKIDRLAQRLQSLEVLLK